MLLPNCVALQRCFGLSPKIADYGNVQPLPGDGCQSKESTTGPIEATSKKVAAEVIAIPALSEKQLESGQSCWQKLQFALALVSPMSAASIFLAKDIYVLELAADVKLMSLAGTILAIWGPVSSILAGYIMDTELLTRCFPWSRWGRRAPWFVTHLVGLAFAAAAIYLPPSWDPIVLCWWYLGWGFLLAWLLQVIFNCFESSRPEIYPTKEERSEVEAFCKVTSGLGNTLGTVPQLVVAAGVNQISLMAAGGTFFCISLISLISVPLFMQAKQDYDLSARPESFLLECWELLSQPAFRILCGYRALEGAINSLAMTGALYYFTFVSGISGADRSFYITLSGLMLGIMAGALLPFWTQFFRVRRSGLNPNLVCGRILAVGLLAPACLLLLRLVLPSPWEFIVYCALLLGSLTGQTYWRAAALCWIVDEDCQAKVGRRREAIFVGCQSLIASVGRAIAVGVFLNALAFAGLELENCAELCRGLDDAAECKKECDLRNFEEQDPAVALSINLFYLVIIPLLQLGASVLVCMFPIHGERLELLYERQAQLYKSSTSASILGKSEE